jgi:hypothetical protein
MFALIAGPVGDYLGYNYQFYIASQGYDSIYTIMGDEGDTMIVDTSTIIDTFTYNGNPAYMGRHVRISTLFNQHDTTLSWEIGDTLFGYLMIEGDTLITKAYVTPFYVGLVWDLGVTGETLITDIDGDNIDDTLVVQTGDGEIVDSLSLNVPLGTFDTYEVLLTVYMTGWQSLINDQCRLWMWNHHWLSPYIGVVQDSTVIIDSIFQYIWLEALRGHMYSEAVDTGYVAVREHASGSVSDNVITPVMNGIMLQGSDHYTVDVYDITGYKIARYAVTISGKYTLIPNLPSGVYFARVRGHQNIATTKFIILR